MGQIYYLPDGDSARVQWIKTFAQELPVYAAVIGVTPAEVTSVENDAAYFDWVVQVLDIQKGLTQGSTKFKNQMRNGVPPGEDPAVLGAPVYPTAPTAVEPGIFPRVTKLIGRIKKSAGYNSSIGEALKIEGPESDFDPDTMQPELTYKVVGGQPTIIWKKDGMTGINVYVSSDGLAFTLGAFDSQPDWPDTRPLPAPGTSQNRFYKARYVYGDEEVGNFSEVLKIVVSG